MQMKKVPGWRMKEKKEAKKKERSGYSLGGARALSRKNTLQMMKKRLKKRKYCFSTCFKLYILTPKTLNERIRRVLRLN